MLHQLQLYELRGSSITSDQGIKKKQQSVASFSAQHQKIALSGPHLAVAVSLPQASLLRMVEPLDSDHHGGAPGLPEALHSAHIGELRPAGR